MQHRIVFREITREDIDMHCRFMPEDHEFEIHLNALANDVEWLAGVTEVSREGSNVIVVTTDATLDILKERLTPLLQSHWAYLRIEF